MSQKVEINIRAIDDASSKIGGMAKNIDRSLGDVGKASDEVVRKQRDMERAIENASDGASRDVADASREIDRSFDDVNRSSDEVVANQRELEQAVDKTSANAASDVDKAAKEMVKDYEDVGKAAENTKQKHELLGKGTKDVITGFSGVATSAFSLYSAYDRVSDMTLQVDKANLQVKMSANSLEDAQRKQTTAAAGLEAAQVALNAAVETFGVDSEQATAAQTVLDEATVKYNASVADAELAQEKYNLKVEAAEQVQDNFNEAIIQSAIQFGVTTITLVDNAGKIWKALDDIGGVSGVVNLVSSKLSGLKDIDFTALLAKIGVVDTSLKGIVTSAGLAASAIGAIAGIAYIGYEQGKKTSTEKITGVVPLPPAAQQMNPSGLFGSGLFGGFKSEGGLVGEHGPELIVVGERGSEFVVSHDELGALGGGVTVHSPVTIHIYGDADERIVQVMKRELRNVDVEASSSGAPSGHSRIRFGSRVG